MSGWLLVSGDFTPLGGMDRANHELARYLADRGPVHLVTHRAWDDLVSHPNVTVHRVPRPLGRHLLGAPLLARAGRRWADRLSREGFRVVVNGGNCQWGDVNWVHCVHAAYPAPIPGGWLRNLKTRLYHMSVRRDERIAIRAARIIICNSHRTARDVTHYLGIDPDRVRVVYLAMDPDRFPPVSSSERLASRKQLGWSNRPWVGFVGQLSNRVKNFDTLYTAWRTLCADPHWDANLAVIGSGSQMNLWRDQAAADGLADRMHFLGFRSDVAEILAAFDAIVHPARYDAYGLAVHEALCRGLPVLVAAAAGIAERYPPELSDLVLPDPEDASALVDRLRFWRRNLEMWPARVADFATTLRAYTWDDMATEFVRAASDTMLPCTPDGNPDRA